MRLEFGFRILNPIFVFLSSLKGQLYSLVNETCPETAVLLQSRKKNRLCVIEITSVQNGKQKNTYSSLLLSAMNKAEGEDVYRLFKINLDHDSSLDLPVKIKATGIIAMVYNSNSQRVILGTSFPNRIISHELTTRRMQILKKKINVRSMVLDTEKQLLFITGLHIRGIYMMTTNTHPIRYSRVIVETIGAVNSHTIDTGSQTIYVVITYSYWVISSFDYRGKPRHINIPLQHDTLLTYDPVRNMLYYIKEKTICGRNILGNVTCFAAISRNFIYNLVINNNKAYVSYSDHAFVSVIELSHNKPQKTITDIKIGSGLGRVICLMP